MDEEREEPVGDEILAALVKQDLDRLSVDDLKERIAALRDEIARSEIEIGKRGDTRSAAEKLFKL